MRTGAKINILPYLDKLHSRVLENRFCTGKKLSTFQIFSCRKWNHFQDFNRSSFLDYSPHLLFDDRNLYRMSKAKIIEEPNRGDSPTEIFYFRINFIHGGS